MNMQSFRSKQHRFGKTPRGVSVYRWYEGRQGAAPSSPDPAGDTKTKDISADAKNSIRRGLGKPASGSRWRRQLAHQDRSNLGRQRLRVEGNVSCRVEHGGQY